MKKIKLFEEFQEDVRRWTKKIVDNEKFHEWFKKNKDSKELKNEYKKYLNNNKKTLDFENWAKEYYFPFVNNNYNKNKLK